ncbi:hypothetical protein [Desulfocurvus sp.]|uniref:hypothetical protein n=1 Tax=Desulfocurvus sp. TaxID=2871698 RepID=UPI0025C3C658|nr:hypothetical protein [Desulfocurvus sp.]MCK9239894.1 hypothetical protein [Desulfocurvus sp.]
MVYEGWIYGVGEWQYSKLSKLLKRAFETVEYVYLEENTGAIRLEGPSAMFEESEENLAATFDLLADQITPQGRGLVLARQWDQRGTARIEAFVFGHESWSRRVLEA